MRAYRFFAPADFQELFATVAAQTDAQVKFLAGGTDLVPRINMERDQIPYEAKPDMAIVSLAGLGLTGIREEEGAIVIGAMTTITQIQDSALLREKAPVLCQAADQMAGFAVRNTATLGGNIMNASPAADSLPALLVLDASVTLRGPGGERQIHLADFFTGPGKTAAEDDEVLTQITIHPGAGRANFQKLGRRAAETLSVVNAAAYIEQSGGVCTAARIAVGSAAPTVRLCEAAANALIGSRLDDAAVNAAAQLVNQVLSPIDDIRSTAWYRLETAPVLVRRAIEAAAGITPTA